MTIRFLYNLRFYPVGQGLFAAGSLDRQNAVNDCFRWVYDCGTLSSQDLVKHAISDLLATSKSSESKPKLGLLAISHFDKDHISGVGALATHFDVGTLLLPYLTLRERLEAAFRSDVPLDDPRIGFFVNPVAYLSGTGMAIDQIIFVLGGGTGTTDNDAITSNIPHEERLRDLQIRGRLFEALGNTEGNDRDADFRLYRGILSSNKPIVQFLEAGGYLTLNGLWEFVPYNDAEFASKGTHEWRAGVKKLRVALLNAGDSKERLTILRRLRSAYDRAFGRSGTCRNIISLFMYSGPMQTSESEWVLERREYGVRVLSLLEHQSGEPVEPRCGVLYTGDGYLNTPARLEQLIAFFSERRIRQSHCLQVMHHGAKGNWHLGVAAGIAPEVSVFSSDPNREKTRHPHAPVVKDFLKFGPVQVDANSQFRVQFHLSLRNTNIHGAT